MKTEKGFDLQLPSNVTRISRAFRRQCSDNTLQVIYYQNGVGTSGFSPLDAFAGAAFGTGISENIREVYSFICANYCDGDEIVLVGFSRGAFTARSVAGLIAGIGLLTREGLEYFYPILKDVENWKVKGYEKNGDQFPQLPPLGTEDAMRKGMNRKPVFGTEATGKDYARLLLEKNFTRMSEKGGKPITIKAIGVWDTVGSLGIPDVAWLSALGLPQSTKEYHFYDTSLSSRIEHAFHALALDEDRPPFAPAVWERLPSCKTKLKQVWFPGTHANTGGGYEEQQMGDISLAWMADQLSSVGVEFKVEELVHLFRKGRGFYYHTESGKQSLAPKPGLHQQQGRGQHHHRQQKTQENSESPKKGLLERVTGLFFSPSPAPSPPAPQNNLLETMLDPLNLHWAIPPIYSPERARVWALGMIHKSLLFPYSLAGSLDRKPGLYRRVNPTNGLEERGQFMQGTNELVHSSARTRLAARGLGLDDESVWSPASLKNWKLCRRRDCERDDVPGAIGLGEARWPDGKEKERTGTKELEYPVPEKSEDDEWVWEYVGRESPVVTVMPEERIGFWERVLMGITVGLPEFDVYEYARKNPPVWPEVEA
ncbi:hypothetical protein MKZ38_010334 [Zalerion maritima]|uniref:T6SS Phospholipase effector Tle1-like catalytic domain-containing protein n=1 Tax=Zalerion maritima TaxID=339359 RepID=A0AAD5WYC1_9PEZI|nr:hypothetical protein MKZ38_010334 [Zalerion maritima]